MSFSLLALSFLCIAAITFSLWIRRIKRARLQLPPGPPSDPFLGHFRIMPTQAQGDTFHEWAKTYGAFFLVSLASRLYLTYILR